MQKYPHIIELFSFTRKVLAFIFLFCEAEDEGQPIKYIQHQNYGNKQFHFLQNEAIQCVPTFACSSRFIIYAQSFIF